MENTVRTRHRHPVYFNYSLSFSSAESSAFRATAKDGNGKEINVGKEHRSSVKRKLSGVKWKLPGHLCSSIYIDLTTLNSYFA
jgi:hypothetical protein